MKSLFSIPALIGFLSLISSNCLQAQLDNLLIQEYVDWNGGDGLGIQIYNPTPDPIDLSDYRIAVYNNGNTSANSTANLTGIILPAEVFITGNSAYCYTNCAGSCDQALSLTGVNDGDVVRLEENGIAVDAIGCVGYSGNFTIEGNLVTSALKWVKLSRKPDNCSRYFNNDGASPNSWPSNPGQNFLGWEISIPTCLSGTAWNYSPQETVTALTICQPDSFELAGTWLHESGTYSHTFQNIQGCDSIITINLSLINQFPDTSYTSLCAGDSIYYADQWQHTAGTYLDTLSTNGLCPEINALVLDFLPAYEFSSNASICENDSFFFDGAWLQDAGTYTQELSTINGCDSTISLNLEVLNAFSSTIAAEICAGDSILIGTEWISAPGTYQTLYVLPSGCDSLVNTNLSLRPQYFQTNNLTICQGETVFLEGSFQSEAGIYTDSLSTTAGCDSIVETILEIASQADLNTNIQLCFGDSLLIEDSWHKTAGTYTRPIEVGGCTYTEFVNLSFLPEPTQQFFSISGCGNAEYNGATYTDNTAFVDTLLSTMGCDSAYLNVSIQVNNLELDIQAIEPVCAHTAFTIHANSNASLSWDNNSSGETAQYSLSESRYIVASADDGNCSIKDSVYVEVIGQPQVSGERSYRLCQGEEMQAELNIDPGAEILWSPAQYLSNSQIPNPIISAQEDMVYTVSVANSCDTISLEVAVSTANTLNLSIANDTTICPGDMAILHASGAQTYSWSPAEWVDAPQAATSLAFPERDTRFELTASDGNCTERAHLNVYIATAPSLNLSAIEILPGESIDLTEYFIDSQITSPTNTLLSPYSDTLITVRHTTEMGCSFTQEIPVEIQAVFYAPNAFTPDQDGLNDIWKVICPSVEEIEIRVFDRWGALVFKTNDPKKGWNGGNAYSSDDYYCPSGMYNYTIKATLPKQKAFNSFGTITLIR